MSWLSGLAGKAESLLNNLDQSAAEALNKVNTEENDRLKERRWTTEEVWRENSDITMNTEIRNFSEARKQLDISKELRMKLNEKKNEHIFDFSRDSSDLRRSSSAFFETERMKETISDKGSSGYKTFYEDGLSDKGGEKTYEDEINVENKLLRSEISSLNQEISALLQRNHKSEEEMKRLRNQVEKVTSQLREADRKYRDISSIKDDFQEMLKVKDNQIVVLQSELNLKRSSGPELNVVSDHRNKISMLDQELRSKNEAFDCLENDILHLRIAADEAKLKLAQTVNNYEKIHCEDRRKVEMMSAQLIVAKQKTDSIQNELKEYKNKAAKILQMKEKVIASLKGNGERVDDQLSAMESSEDLLQHNSNLREENDLLREEVSRLRVELENKDFDLQEQDIQMHTETESLRKNLDLLEEQLDREKQQREDTDSDFRQLTRENRHLQEKYMREKADFHDHLATKDEELERMRLMLSTKQMGQNDQVMELDARVRSLTDTLIQRQTFLEASKAAYHSLKIRLERTENELETHKQASLTSSSFNDRRSATAVSNSEFVAVNIRDAPVVRNLKTAVNKVDRLSIRVGVFLRRYPPARLFFLSYILVLHFWVLLVLLTYQPEIHPGGPGPVPPIK